MGVEGRAERRHRGLVHGICRRGGRLEKPPTVAGAAAAADCQDRWAHVHRDHWAVVGNAGRSFTGTTGCGRWERWAVVQRDRWVVVGNAGGSLGPLERLFVGNAGRSFNGTAGRSFNGTTGWSLGTLGGRSTGPLGVRWDLWSGCSLGTLGARSPGPLGAVVGTSGATNPWDRWSGNGDGRSQAARLSHLERACRGPRRSQA
jgi:hypothetical protein